MAAQVVETVSAVGVESKGRLPSQSIGMESSANWSSSQTQIQLANESTFTELANQLQLPSTEDEYAIQFFGFTPKTFCNGIYNAVNFFLVENLETLATFLLQQFPSNLSEDDVRIGCEAVRSKFISAIDKAFDKLEKYLESNLLYIPDYVLLKEDQPHALNDTTEEEDSVLDEDIQMLSTKIWNLKYANSALRDELNMVEIAQAQSDAILDKFVMIQKLLKMNRVSDLRESVLFTLGRAHKCVELLNKLKQLSEQTEPQWSVQNQNEVPPTGRATVEIIQKAFQNGDTTN